MASWHLGPPPESLSWELDSLSVALDWWVCNGDLWALLNLHPIQIVPPLLETKTKTTQSNEITSLKRSVKKLEKKNKSRNHKLKRLYKVGLTARVESSDEESLGEDASKQGKGIDAIDQDEDITLVNVQDDEKMFDVNDFGGKEVFVVKQEVGTKRARLDEEAAKRLQAEFDEEERLAREKGQKEQEANIALIETWDDIQAKIDADHQLTERLQA
nr:hypothetical protein [Tanacetum cinerariifolium]